MYYIISSFSNISRIIIYPPSLQDATSYSIHGYTNNTDDGGFKFEDDPCLAGFMGQWGPPPLTPGTSRDTFNNRQYPKRLQKKLVQYRFV